MDVSPALLWQLVLTLCFAPLAYFLKQSLDRLRQLEKSLAETQVQLAREYATKSDLHADISRVLDRLDRLDTKLDTKLDALLGRSL